MPHFQQSDRTGEGHSWRPWKRCQPLNDETQLPFSSGLEARAGRKIFLPECLFPLKGETECHTSYPSSGECKDKSLLCEAAARAPVTEFGWEGFSYCWCHAWVSRWTWQTSVRVGASGVTAARCAATLGCEPSGGMALGRFWISLCFYNAEVISVAFQRNPPEGCGTAGLQLMSGRVMEIRGTPGHAKNHTLLQWCVGGGRKINPAHQECLNQNRECV